VVVSLRMEYGNGDVLIALPCADRTAEAVFVSDIAVFVLKRDVKLQPTNLQKLLCVCAQIAAEVSAPLSKTEEIVLLGDDRATSEVSRLLASVPPSVQALTGVDVSKVCRVSRLLAFVLVTSPLGRGAKYCDQHVCLSARMSQVYALIVARWRIG